MRVAILQLLHRLVLILLQGYWTIFFRATQFVSRRQEYRADELACYITAPDIVISGLKKVHAANAAFGSYWTFDVNPFLNMGYRPPIAEGFAMFLQSPEVAKQVEELVQKELNESKTSAYDSHPLLRDRIAAASRLSIKNQDCPPGLATDLFGNLWEEEQRLLSWQNDPAKVNALKPLHWQNLFSVLPQIWAQIIKENSQFLGEYTTESLADIVSNLRDIGSRIPDPKGMLLTPEQRTGRAAELFGTALALALSNAGWLLHVQPGERYFDVEGARVSARELMGSLAAKKITRDEWVGRCHQLKIYGMRLAGAKTESATN